MKTMYKSNLVLSTVLPFGVQRPKKQTHKNPCAAFAFTRNISVILSLARSITFISAYNNLKWDLEEIIRLICKLNCLWLVTAVRWVSYCPAIQSIIWIYFIAGVGKTCLLLRYANDSFAPTFITTIGIDFKIKNIILDSKRIKLQVRDY